MSSAPAIRLQVEAALASRIPSALTPAPKILRPVADVGIPPVDAVLDGGLPLGAITELVGPECSGRTSFALSFLSRQTQTGKVFAWIDVSNSLHPESAAAAGIDLSRLLWVRCGVSAPQRMVVPGKPWPRMEQALRLTDLLLQAGGFSAIVLDMGGIAPEHASRVPLATWFRYRAAAERSQASILLLTQHACAKSSAGLVLHLRAGGALHGEATVFTGMEYRVEVTRERFKPHSGNVIQMRKPPQRVNTASWQSRATWVGRR